MVTTLYSPNGDTYEIVRVRSGNRVLGKRGTKAFKVLKNGQSIGETGKSISAVKALISQKDGIDVSKIFDSEQEYKDFQQTEEYTSDFKEALKKSEFSQKQAIEQAGKMQQTLQAQAGGVQLQQLTNALLQQGYTPEEAQQIASSGTEAIQRTASQTQQQVDAQKLGVEAQTAQQNVGAVTSATDLENRLRQMTTQESQFDQQLAMQKEANKTSFGDVLGSVVGMGVGSLTGGFGTAAGTALASNFFKTGGQVPKNAKGGFQSGFLEGQKQGKTLASQLNRMKTQEANNQQKNKPKSKSKMSNNLIDFFK